MYLERQTASCLLRRMAGAAVVLLAGFTQTAEADEIKMLASNAVCEAYRELVPVFEKATGSSRSGRVERNARYRQACNGRRSG